MDVVYWIILFVVVSIPIHFSVIATRKKKLVNSIKKSDEISLPFELPWEIKSYESTDMTLYDQPKPMVLTDNFKSHISNLIKLTPTAKDIVRSERKLIVKFSEEALSKLKSGELKIMNKKGSLDKFRAIAVDQKNNIQHHGWLEIKNIKKVNPAQLTNAVLGVMTIITAQEHLDKINKQLTAIDRKIEALLRLDHNDRIGKIQGSIRYLKSILPDIRNINESNLQLYSNKVEDITLQCYQEMQSILQEFPKMINNTNTIREKTRNGIDKTVNELKDLTSTFEQKILIAFGNLEVLSICLKIRNDLEKSSEVNLNRLSDIEQYYKQLLVFHEKFSNILKNKQLGLDATFRTSKAISKRKEEIEKQLTFHNQNISIKKSAVDQHINQLKSSEDAFLDGPIDLQVEYDEEDNVTAVYRLNQAN